MGILWEDSHHAEIRSGVLSFPSGSPTLLRMKDQARRLLLSSLFSVSLIAGLLSCNNTRIGDDPINPLEGLTGLRIEPADQTLEVVDKATATARYKAFGQFPDGERELTSSVSFSLDNTGVGSFSGATFQSLSGRGGDTNVIATLKTDAAPLSATAHLVVHLSATVRIEPPAGMGTPLPADPGRSFQGTPVAARAPQLVYPNDGVMLPPNIQSLEVHVKPGAAQNTLFQLSFQSASTSVTTYTRCGAMVAGGCVIPVDPETYSYVAASNSGGPPIRLRVRGSDDGATGFGESAEFKLQFAQEGVSGALYYWSTSSPVSILRVDFGSVGQTPKPVLQEGVNTPACVGCHALSRDGSKMVSSLRGIGQGQLVYIADLTKDTSMMNSPGLTVRGDSAESTANRIQFAAFNPSGSRFAATYGDGDPPARNLLFFHDGNTGLRIAADSVDLGFEPSHVDWSPDGRLIALTHVGIHNAAQRPLNSGIEVLTQNGSKWNAAQAVVPITTGKNRYNPSFAPDSSFLTFSESTCPGGNNSSDQCDGDADQSARTWAVKPQPGAQPVLLARASAPGVMDGMQKDLSDTFARSSPFQRKQGSGRLFWLTISSRRKGGLRDPGDPASGKQWLWMFAVDPDKIAAGQDGSFPAFLLPFQDLNTSNHIGQWAERVVRPPG